MKAFLEHFAAILGAATAALIAMSWTHEYGYFSTIGRQFQTFLTTGDYITNGVLWLPLAVLFVWQTVSWPALAVEQKDKPKIGTWPNRALWVVWIVWAAYMIASITWPLEYAGAAAILIFVVSFWSTKWRSVYAKLALEEPFQAIARELIRVGPPILIGMYLYGSTNAADDLTRTDSVYLFKFKDEKTHPQLYIFLRNFERGVLARDAVENRILFLKWDDIKEVALRRRTEVTRLAARSLAGSAAISTKIRSTRLSAETIPVQFPQVGPTKKLAAGQFYFARTTLKETDRDPATSQISETRPSLVLPEYVSNPTEIVVSKSPSEISNGSCAPRSLA